MNNLFLIIFCISFLCIPVFILWALINLIRRKPAKKRFASAGISALALIASTIGFGFTMDNNTSPTESVNVASESPAAIEESQTLQPTTAPTVTPTVIPTATPTPTKAPTIEPTNPPTPQPTFEPTPSPTAAPTLQPTEKPQATPSPIESKEPQTENTTETQTVAESASQPATVSESQPVVESSKQGTGAGESNFNTYDNAEQQQTADTYVLNTSTKRIHYPGCSSVPKIAPQNYATSSASLDELLAKDYKPCGNCFK